MTMRMRLLMVMEMEVVVVGRLTSHSSNSKFADSKSIISVVYTYNIVNNNDKLS